MIPITLTARYGGCMVTQHLQVIHTVLKREKHGPRALPEHQKQLSESLILA